MDNYIERKEKGLVTLRRLVRGEPLSGVSAEQIAREEMLGIVVEGQGGSFVISNNRYDTETGKLLEPIEQVITLTDIAEQRDHLQKQLANLNALEIDLMAL